MHVLPFDGLTDFLLCFSRSILSAQVVSLTFLFESFSGIDEVCQRDRHVRISQEGFQRKAFVALLGFLFEYPSCSVFFVQILRGPKSKRLVVRRVGFRSPRACWNSRGALPCPSRLRNMKSKTGSTRRGRLFRTLYTPPNHRTNSFRPDSSPNPRSPSARNDTTASPP